MTDNTFEEVQHKYHLAVGHQEIAFRLGCVKHSVDLDDPNVQKAIAVVCESINLTVTECLKKQVGSDRTLLSIQACNEAILRVINDEMDLPSAQ